jgi:Uma2 family endonuclease
VVRGVEADFVEKHPATAELVIEVAVASPALDRLNTEVYAEAGVKEYWIVLGSQQRVEVYRNPQAGRYEQTSLLGPTGALESLSVPGLTIDLAMVFRK